MFVARPLVMLFRTQTYVRTQVFIFLMIDEEKKSLNDSNVTNRRKRKGF